MFSGKMDSKCENFRIISSALIGLIFILSGCESKLDLSNVRSAQEASTARYDNYQAAAKSNTTTIIIGNRGTVLNSNDKGLNWVRSALPGDTPTSFPTLVDVEFCADNHFIALDADRKIWISDLDGSNWISKPISTQEEVLDLTCDPKGNIWVVGSFTLILQSRDGGDTWQDKSISEDAMFSRVQFVDSDNGFVTGEFGTVFSTSNGGETWEAQNYIPNEFYPMASLFISADKGWVGGLQGIIFSTEDGGQSWARQNTSTVAPIYNIVGIDGEIYALGEQGTILILSGSEWKPVDVDMGFGYLRAAIPLDEENLLIAGGGGLLKVLANQKLKIKYTQIN